MNSRRRQPTETKAPGTTPTPKGSNNVCPGLRATLSGLGGVFAVPDSVGFTYGYSCSSHSGTIYQIARSFFTIAGQSSHQTCKSSELFDLGQQLVRLLSVALHALRLGKLLRLRGVVGRLGDGLLP